MDIKSKSSRIFGSIILACIVIIVAARVVATYDYFWKVVDSKVESPYKSDWFTEYLTENVYSLYVDVAEERAGKELKPSDVYLNIVEEEKETDNIDIEDSEETEITTQKDSVKIELNDWLDDLKNRTKENHNLKYQVADNTSGEVVTSYDWTFSEDTKDEYDSYITLVFDKRGEISIKYAYNIDTQFLIDRLRSFVSQYEYSDSGVSYSIEPIVDTTFHYAVPKELQPYDTVYWHQEWKNENVFYTNSGFPFVILGATLFIMIIALLLSSKKLFKLGAGITSKIPFEIVATAGVLDLHFAICMSEVIYKTHTGEMAKDLISIGISDKLIPLIHIGAWSIILGVVAIITLSMKQLLVKGLLEYCSENVIVTRIIRWCYKKIKRFVNKMTEINVDDTVNKNLFKILSINLIVLTLLCSIWFFGIAGLIIYTIVMFFFLQKKMNQLKDDYDRILEITDSLAKGKLNVTEERDLGLFEPIKTNLTMIQGGFKKAVEEELKSQNMKTELISNVSHDLKTPLTAIITYVNLLKNDEITEEERKSYIETLDKKSERLKQLIEDLFEVSKANSGNLEVNLDTVEVLSLIRQVELELAEKLEEVGIELSIRSNQEKVYLELDGQKSCRIFENLFGNLVKYAMPNRKAYVDVIVNDAGTQIEVKNMSKEELDFDTSELTERFVRGDKSRNSEGSGLGLAIVKSLVELQGGEFQIVADGDLFKAIIRFENK
ncbi:sensor histidine kinase [Anaerosporobacter sp.]